MTLTSRHTYKIIVDFFFYTFDWHLSLYCINQQVVARGPYPVHRIMQSGTQLDSKIVSLKEKILCGPNC